MRSSRTTAAVDVKALWKAAKRHDSALVKQLLVRAASASSSLELLNEFHPRKGTTPLMAACKKRETEHKHPERSGAATVQMLLEFGADMTLQSRDRDANTALHLAAANNQVRAVEFMVHAGVDAFALNAHGHAALDVARWHRSRDVVDVLTQQARIHSGWLYVKAVKTAQADSSIKILHVWKKRWAVALACDAHRRVVELSLFKDRGDVRPARVVLLKTDTHTLVSSPKRKWLDRHNMFHVDRPLVVQKTKARRFSRAAQDQQAIEQHGDTELMQFAADSPAQREAWISILRRSDHGLPLPLHAPALVSRLPASPPPPPGFNVSQWAPVAPTPIVFVESMLPAMSLAASPQRQDHDDHGHDHDHDLLGVGQHAPLSPLGPATITVSPAHVSSLNGVFTSPRQRDEPSAPSFISDGGDVTTSFYEQQCLSSLAAMAAPPAPLSASAAEPLPLSSQRSECVICMDAPRDAICVPCGHVAGCFVCLTKQAQGASGCPICRSHVQTVVKIYEC